MNKYFTKEYIKECDCPEIQELRRKGLEYGDWFWSSIHVGIYYKEDPELFFFLPTGDQLDEEIVKICKKKNYTFKSDFYLALPKSKNHKEFYEITYFKWLHSYCVNNIKYTHTNPYLAKIKLLKELLK